jgi:phosphoribosylformylglycinamidine cyclo-ligase
MENDQQPKLTYSQSGVDIAKADSAIDKIKQQAESTLNSNVIAGIGGFASLYKLDLHKYSNPVLVSGTDGVGTKLKIAIESNIYHSIGIDLVAMCINDIITTGADPLFFLDYYATGKLDETAHEQVLKGIIEGCALANCALVGGETAELPGLYSKKDFDLAGFAVGCVNEHEIIDGSQISSKDVILGIPSSGFHSNGFSLIRKICFELHKMEIDSYIPEFKTELTNLLLEPTSIYFNDINTLKLKYHVKGIAHITGGGPVANLRRILPDKNLKIHFHEWQLPALFQWIQALGNITDEELFNVFNCGIGIMIVASQDEARKIWDESEIDLVNLGEII